jgi:HSP20 family protein
MLACRTVSNPVFANVPMTDLSSHVDRLLNEAFRGFAGGEVPVPYGTAKPFPALNMWHDESAFHIEAELPGFSMNDVEINLKGRELTLNATRNTDSTTQNAEFLRRERASGTFSRTVRLPVSVDADKVSAKLTSGVLTITLPKAAEVLPRKINVTVA